MVVNVPKGLFNEPITSHTARLWLHLNLILSGTTSNFLCRPTPKVKWYFNDKTDEIKDGKNGYELQALTFNRLLIIKTVNKVQHEGKYTCTVDNGVGQSMSSSTQLRVSGILL